MGKEEDKRLADIAINGDIKPDELIKRTLEEAIVVGNPFINPSDNFVVVGIDGFDGSVFPCGSFLTPEDAHKLRKKRAGEESLYSSDEEVSTTFHVFTMDGRHVPDHGTFLDTNEGIN